MTQHANQIKEYLLTIEDRPVTIRSSHWQINEIYLNDVCMVVIVTPVADGETAQTTAKEELYSLLRSISSRALHHNLMRPLAAIVQVSNISQEHLREIATWGADQEWHRGEFTLYVEDGRNVVPTAEELLDTKLDILTKTRFTPRSALEVFPSLDTMTDPSSELKTLHEHTKALLESIDPNKDETKRLAAVEAGMERWRHGIESEN